jgi:hypothetical protein
MPDANTATPLPDPNAGANPNPNLTVLDGPEAAATRRSVLNRAQAAELTKARDVCVAAQRTEYAAALDRAGIKAAFVTALLADIDTAHAQGNTALDCTAAVKDATRAETATARTLIGTLQTVQARARQQHLPDRTALSSRARR